MMLKEGDKVQSGLGAEGVVEAVEIGKDGQELVWIRWKTGVLGAYTREEVSRYKIVKVATSP
ncbi:MAG TPA: hypothetical protein EYP90_00270 [Chromatiaceae bacterium]|nr:hypothetical protein [Chromatiaceae bacterium]